MEEGSYYNWLKITIIARPQTRLVEGHIIVTFVTRQVSHCVGNLGPLKIVREETQLLANFANFPLG